MLTGSTYILHLRAQYMPEITSALQIPDRDLRRSKESHKHEILARRQGQQPKHYGRGDEVG
jgi:hypothetical protein